MALKINLGSILGTLRSFNTDYKIVRATNAIVLDGNSFLPDGNFSRPTVVISDGGFGSSTRYFSQLIPLSDTNEVVRLGVISL